MKHSSATKIQICWKSTGSRGGLSAASTVCVALRGQLCGVLGRNRERKRIDAILVVPVYLLSAIILRALSALMTQF